MLPHFPVEILRLIVEKFQLPDFSSHRRTVRFENERRSTLYNLSLTSRTFHEIVQPFLFQFVRINDDEQLQQLIDNNKANNRLRLVRSLVFEEEVDFEVFNNESSTVRVVDGLEELVGYCNFLPLRCFSGPNLKRLFLNGTQLDLLSGAKSLFPSLEVLGLRNVDISDPMTAAERFPVLRHFAYDSSNGYVDEVTATLLARLAPQLHSVTFVSDVHLTAISKVPSLQARSILVNLSWPFWDGLIGGGTMQTVYHLRLLVADVFGSADGWTTCDEIIATLASSLELRLPSLESIYLPPLGSLPVGDFAGDIFISLDQLVQACQARKIKVIYEEQSDGNTAECQVSEEFMRRMTMKKTEREVLL